MDEYWDMCLDREDMSGVSYENGMSERCLISHIDSDNPDCILFDSLYGNRKYYWNDRNINPYTLYNIGFTGVDNGLVSYDRTKVSNREFLKLFMESELNIDETYDTLKLTRVTGHTMQYDYPMSVVHEEGMYLIKLNGGFYQGFFKDGDCKGYQILPHRLDSSWSLEFTLKRHEHETESAKTLNDTYPENKGMFFYIGTRAENKWWKEYDRSDRYKDYERCDLYYFSSDYVDDGYEAENGHLLNMDYVVEDYIEPYFEQEYMDYCECYQHTNCKCVEEMSYFASEYFKDDTLEDCNCDLYYNGDYMDDIVIDENMTIRTRNGFSFYNKDCREIWTDNKFLLFNRTCSGTTVSDWDGDDSEFLIVDETFYTDENMFLVFNRTCTGTTASTISHYEAMHVKEGKYNVFNDIHQNALGLRITDNGAVGYRYIVNDCESDYKMVEEYSYDDVFPYDKWSTVHVKIEPLGAWDKRGKMKLYFYVNGKLKLISNELPMLYLRDLKDLHEKQEGVPYNISLGGGTQGLAETIGLNYFKVPEHKLPLEKHFAGTFIGYIKTFRFYECPLNFQEINSNHDFDMNETTM